MLTIRSIKIKLSNYFWIILYKRYFVDNKFDIFSTYIVLWLFSKHTFPKNYSTHKHTIRSRIFFSNRVRPTSFLVFLISSPFVFLQPILLQQHSCTLASDYFSAICEMSITMSISPFDRQSCKELWWYQPDEFDHVTTIESTTQIIKFINNTRLKLLDTQYGSYNNHIVIVIINYNTSMYFF